MRVQKNIANLWEVQPGCRGTMWDTAQFHKDTQRAPVSRAVGVFPTVFSSRCWGVREDKCFGCEANVSFPSVSVLGVKKKFILLPLFFVCGSQPTILRLYFQLCPKGSPGKGSKTIHGAGDPMGVEPMPDKFLTHDTISLPPKKNRVSKEKRWYMTSHLSCSSSSNSKNRFWSGG